ncbi:uncharacterized protein LOC119589626 [Penaeus monodon]|uniref:uncharacterized protein LOC119589626 n=1 Tax=Penaeus monodon TaxID=6687 RepID=UPI0018A73FEA|nr:uncharacterized protein LOC119589626 [Penaeus monodon]
MGFERPEVMVFAGVTQDEKNKVDAQDCGNYRGSMRKSSIPEVLLNVVQDVYNECMTAVRSAVGTTEGFKVEVGLHQGVSLFLFSVIMDKLNDWLKKGASWSMMYADDIVLCSENREVEKDLERWRHALERHGMKVRRKTEYFCVNEKEGDGRVKMQGKNIEKVNKM